MKRLGLKILGSIIVGFLLLQSSVVIAATKTELNNSQAETNKKIEEAKEELEGIQSEKSETRQR